MSKLTSLEVCAGAGGQALGLDHAGFDHVGLVEIDKHCCATLRHNRPKWNVLEADIRSVDGKSFHGIDLFAGGLPCPPFSVAGKQLGDRDERNLFGDALRIIAEAAPKMVLIENVRGFLDPVFAPYRDFLRSRLAEMGYIADWRLLNASDFGVPQLRPRVAIVAGLQQYWRHFRFPAPKASPASVGEVLFDLMAAEGWEGAADWARRANEVAPTIVGGSKKHGGPDLGPTRARAAWARLGVNGKTIGETAPAPGFADMPRLTPRMVARLQGFPDDWHFTGRKTQAYKQIGNAFPPPVAMALGAEIREAIIRGDMQSDLRMEVAAE
ncbi:DNA cytosine methyltransferase [Tabrizicola sp.]|jgi:DNA (cytosine-5)-methyltransferase 1|uniref:DNA cytosine methyltransferase n=1 Tax=Tabrizicola sp. TaxID=2005166 RepID=UPI001A5C4BDB|nr:DNA cytosine methyltransferase [Tabrizicola sp.]MBL9061932.1 DNA cytosine methyltransferase [Tabrizicola sp.]